MSSAANENKYWVNYNSDTGVFERFEKDSPPVEPGKTTNDFKTPVSYPIKSYGSTSSGYTKKTGGKKSGSKSGKKIDIDDLDVEGLYRDYPDEFEDVDDAYDYLEDNPDEWDDYY